MKLIPYLTFDGEARGALAHYSAVFGVAPAASMTFGDMPEQPDWVTDANRDRLAHGRLEIGGAELMISDSAGFEPWAGHAGHSINVVIDRLDEARRVFDALAEGGTVTMPFTETFWAKGFGTCRDKFGVSWMVNVED